MSDALISLFGKPGEREPAYRRFHNKRPTKFLRGGEGNSGQCACGTWMRGIKVHNCPGIDVVKVLCAEVYPPTE